MAEQPNNEEEQIIRKMQAEYLTKSANQMLMTANALQKNIDTAKTQYKRDYYGKKMKKVRDGLHKTLATLELLKMTGSQNAPTETSATTNNQV